MAIKIENLTYIYSPKTAYERIALDKINIEINDGDFIGLIGHTGSGKSTLVQHLNGLLKANSGSIYYNGQNIYDEGYNFRELRSKVGLVFQYPEHQLFGATIFEDVAFGPTNQGLSKAEIEEKTKKALAMVGISENMYETSPFEISGGQKRRVAIAGVLAMEPDVLVLDEPTAGLDPKGRDEILEQIRKLHLENNITIVLVSHSMEDVAKYANRIIVMNNGQVMFNDEPKAVFAHYKKLEEIGLAAPAVTYIMNGLKELGYNLNTSATTLEEAKDEILSFINRNK
ncbi:MAG: energy-coupling factor transporter ATPase [Clostridiales bacterium]|nr:energy-coupling factor transporter ATPase [Clostridiales bacterium]